MRICVAQTLPVKGDMDANNRGHWRLLQIALTHSADLVVFPELSLTGYEPTLAAELIIEANDARLLALQELSDSRRVTLCVGLPTRNADGVCISLAVIRPHRPLAFYDKAFLHEDETPHFVEGDRTPGLIGDDDCALAICYELSVPVHVARAAAQGAQAYLASVVKPRAGFERAVQRMSEIARDHAMLVFMANSVGVSDGFPCAGGSAVWNRDGSIISQLDDRREGVIVVDTDELTHETIQVNGD